MADNQHSLATYVSDMLALERHIHIPFEMQSKDEDFNKYGSARDIVGELVTLSERHIADLTSALARLGGHEAAPVKSAATVLEGFLAGAIDKMRKTKVSKALRDDYTALALCTASYTMLTSTALAMNDAHVASLAEKHLRDYARCVMQISDALLDVVVEELQAIGLQVATGTAEQTKRATKNMWRSSSDSVDSTAPSR